MVFPLQEVRPFGGAIWYDKGTIIYHFCGGGIFASGNITLVNNTIYGNEAGTVNNSARGGGVYAEGAITLINNTIYGNKLVAGNENGNNGGGGLYAKGATLINNTIYGNSSVFDETTNSGVYAENATLINNIIWGNEEGDLYPAGATTYSYNLIGKYTPPGDSPDDGTNITGTDKNPLFTDAAAGDFRLQQGSPAIDKGSDALYEEKTGTSLPDAIDAAGQPRRQGNRIDIGAYESPYTRPEPVDYHTISLDVAPGIELYNLRPGELLIEDGRHLYLQFLPEDRRLTAGDVLFRIDGVETPFKNLGENHYFSYILNPIKTDHTVLIALREYPVTLPEVDGATTDPAAGEHRVAYGKPFGFTLSFGEETDPSAVEVYANDRLLETDPLRLTTLAYTISEVEGPVDIRIEGVSPTGNTQINESGISFATDNGQLIIENRGEATQLKIYTLTSQLYTNRALPPGTTKVDLPRGIFIVHAGKTTGKILVK